MADPLCHMRIVGCRRPRMDATQYQSALSGIGGRLRPSKWMALAFLLGPRRIARTLARRARDLADELAEIVPPTDVASEHRALVEAIGRTASELDDVSRRNGLKAFERFDAMAELDLARNELSAVEAKGYRVGR